MRERAELEVDQHMAAQQAVVEDEVDEEMLVVEAEALLPRLEQKALAEFEQELAEAVDDGAFQIGVGLAALFGQAEKFQHQRFLEQVLRLTDDLAFARQLADAFLVAAQGQPFVEAAVELALEFAQRPALLGGFDFVEAAFVGVLDTEQEDVV